MVVLLLACHPKAEVAVVATRDLGPLETTSAIKARDGGYSVAFQGKTVWLYGDTIHLLEKMAPPGGIIPGPGARIWMPAMA
jgi:hypothetical protein